MIVSRTMLGLAVSEGAIEVAEVGLVSDRPAVLRGGRFVASGEAGPDALRHFLKRNHFSTSRCVIGLEAGWVVAKEKLLPPASAAAIAGALSIAAERDFGSSAGEFVFDCTAPSESPAGTATLLVAASRQKLDDAAGVARAAGLTPLAATPSALALATATAVSTVERLVLCVCPEKAELVMQAGSRFRLLRRLSAPVAGQPERLASEAARVMSFLPAASESDGGRELLIWDAGYGLDTAAVDLLRERLAMPARLCRFPEDLGMGASGAGGGPQTVQAAALAAAALARRPAIVDFLHSRLAPPRAARLSRYAKWAIAGAVAACAAIGGFVLDWLSKQDAIAALEAKLDGIKSDAASASEAIDNLAFARPWYGGRPRYLECLREMTLLFPEEGRSWATSIVMRDKGKVLLSGKSESEGAALEILDRLKASKGFVNVKSLYIRDAGGSSQGSGQGQDVSFAISFELAGAQ